MFGNQANDFETLGYCYHNVGYAYQNLGKLHKAKSCYEKSILIYEKTTLSDKTRNIQCLKNVRSHLNFVNEEIDQ